MCLCCVQEVCLFLREGSFIKGKRKMYLETKMFYPLIYARTCAYKKVSSANFLENIATVLNEWSPR